MFRTQHGNIYISYLNVVNRTIQYPFFSFLLRQIFQMKNTQSKNGKVFIGRNNPQTSNLPLSKHYLTWLFSFDSISKMSTVKCAQNNNCTKLVDKRISTFKLNAFYRWCKIISMLLQIIPKVQRYCVQLPVVCFR